MEMIKVKPIEGRIVIHPVSMVPIKQEGEVVEKCIQIRRYLKFGDLELVVDKPKKKQTKKTGE